jgi:PAS domain S-box-containing protein
MVNYGVVVLSTAVALSVALMLPKLPGSALFMPFLCVTMFCAWFGGVGPGIFAAVLCGLAYDYFFMLPRYSLALDPEEIPNFIVILLSSIFVGSLSAAQKRATDLLRNARDQLHRTNQDLVRTNEELRRSEAFLAEGQEISHTGSWGWNITAGKLVWSKEHYRLFGYAPETTPTFDLFLERLHPQDRPVIQQMLDEAFRANSSFNCEFRIVLPDGSIRHAKGIGRPVRQASGDIGEFVGTTVDITERKKVEEALRKAHEDLERRVLERTAELAQRSQELARSNRELEQMAYVASHDLQEPLRMVASYLQLLEQRYGERLDADAHDFIGFAVDGAKRMQNLINDLLSYSRVGTRAQPLKSVDCTALVATALRALRVAVDESGAHIEYGALPLVMGDEAQLTQLFQNLLSNAIKFRGQQAPRIAIWAEPDGGFWRFAVQDNGIGIAPEYFDKIFGMFQRLHSRAKYSGTGIGLAICKKIVERHGGRIWVETAPQQGAIFKFTLPQNIGERHE